VHPPPLRATRYNIVTINIITAFFFLMMVVLIIIIAPPLPD
jgi:hypothetical protein